MASVVKDIKNLIDIKDDPEFLKYMVGLYDNMCTSREKWDNERDEILTYLYATDTMDTVGIHTDFDNSTTIPKMAQIYNNIKTGYMEHLFPNEDYVQWVPADATSSTQEKKKVITAYVRSKMKASKAEMVIEQMVDDIIQCGICGCMTRYITKLAPETARDYENGGSTTIYTGPELIRIDPINIYYDTMADRLDVATKCIVSYYTMGDLKDMVSSESGALLTQEQFDTIRDRRSGIRTLLSGRSTSQTYIQNQLERAGYQEDFNLLTSDKVEVLTFYGTFYDVDNDILYKDHKIVIADRAVLLTREPPTSWRVSQGIHIGVWDYREGTLAPMGPLNRIVGLQYKLDKLENLRADVFDAIAHPRTVEAGDVQFFPSNDAFGGRYVVEEGGSVNYLVPPMTALSADTQIQLTMALMEELAGSPKESVGQRTPGEKTKFEVQLLDSGQNKLFRSKVKKFEREVVTEILVDYLALGRKFLDVSDVVAMKNAEFNTDEFINITRADLAGNGSVIAAGATIFADKANALQNLVTLANTGLWRSIDRHISRKLLANTVMELSDLDKFNLVIDNIGIQEDIETQQLAEQASADAQEVNMTNAKVTNSGDINEA